MNSPEPLVPAGGANPQLVSYTHLIYGLHALSVLLGIVGSHFVATMFVLGLPSLVAVVMNYARRAEAAGSFLESHFRWQIHTFWYAALAVWLLFLSLFTIVLIPLAWLGYLAVGVWVIYRVVRGWLALRDGQPVPA